MILGLRNVGFVGILSVAEPGGEKMWEYVGTSGSFNSSINRVANDERDCLGSSGAALTYLESVTDIETYDVDHIVRVTGTYVEFDVQGWCEVNYHFKVILG